MQKYMFWAQEAAPHDGVESFKQLSWRKLSKASKLSQIASYTQQFTKQKLESQINFLQQSRTPKLFKSTNQL